MLAILELKTGKLAYFEFGDPLDPKRDAEAHLRWVLADYTNRRDEQWCLSPPVGDPVLVRLLEEAGNQPEKLLPLIRALGWYGIPESSLLVSKYLGHHNVEIKLAAIKSLGQMGLYDSIRDIWPFLDNPERTFRRVALVALGKFGKKEVLPKLEATAGSDAKMQPLFEQAERRIEAVASGELAAVVEAVIGTDEYEDLLVFIVFAWESVAMILSDRKRTNLVRCRAARLLGLGRVRKATRALITILNDTTETVELQVQVAIALGRLEAWKALDILILRLNSTEPTLQEAVVVSLGQIGKPQAFAPLLKQWDERSGALREKIRLAVRQLCSVSGTQLLTDMLKRNALLSTPGIYFIEDSLDLSQNYRSDLVDFQLNSKRIEARRDAILLLAYFGQRDDADKLAKLSQQDEDSTNRDMAQLGYNRLRLIPR
jgi:HEAT repeat protein